MKALNNFKHLLLVMLLAISGAAMAQSISGSTNVVKGSTTTYTWNPPGYSYTQYMGGTIYVSGGVFAENSKTYLSAPYGKTFSIIWSTTGSVGKVWVEYTMRYYSPGCTSPTCYTQSGLLKYEKLINKLDVGAATSITGDQSVTVGETAAYSWLYISENAADVFTSATITTAGGVIVDNNTTTIAGGEYKNFSVKWTSVSGKITVAYTYKRNGTSYTTYKYLDVTIAGASGCYTVLTNNSMYQLSGNACTLVNNIESYYFKSYPVGQVHFTGATLQVTGGVFTENNSTIVNTGIERTIPVRWTTPGQGSLKVTYNYYVSASPNGPIYYTSTLNFPVAVFNSARTAEFEEATIATENLIYPNPATAGSEVFINNAGTSVEKVIVRNLEGQTQHATVTLGEKISIATAGMKKGMYVVQVISTEGKSTTHKFSVE